MLINISFKPTVLFGDWQMEHKTLTESFLPEKDLDKNT